MVTSIEYFESSLFDSCLTSPVGCSYFAECVWRRSINFRLQPKWDFCFVSSSGCLVIITLPAIYYLWGFSHRSFSVTQGCVSKVSRENQCRRLERQRRGALNSDIPHMSHFHRVCLLSVGLLILTICVYQWLTKHGRGYQGYQDSNSSICALLKFRLGEGENHK